MAKRVGITAAAQIKKGVPQHGNARCGHRVVAGDKFTHDHRNQVCNNRNLHAHQLVIGCAYAQSLGSFDGVGTVAAFDAIH